MKQRTPLADSGARTTFDTGAQKEIVTGNGRFDLLEPELLFREAVHYENGAIKYSDRNWEKGIKVSCHMNSILRHATKYLAGWRDEDHLAAIVWHVACIMRWEKDKRIDLLDLPWQKEFYGRNEKPNTERRKSSL